MLIIRVYAGGFFFAASPLDPDMNLIDELSDAEVRALMRDMAGSAASDPGPLVKPQSLPAATAEAIRGDYLTLAH